MEWRPTVVSEPDGEDAKRYKDMARQIAAKLARAATHGPSGPKLVVTDD